LVNQEFHKVIKLFRMGEEIEELDKKTLRECDMKIRESGLEDDDDEETLDDEDDKDQNVSRPDEAEGQRPNLTCSDLSKLSLGRMKQRICTDVNDIRSLWIREQVTLRHFVSSKVSTLPNRADYLTKQ